jgi:D-inositol-3-phosphate glycosyltransferase
MTSKAKRVLKRLAVLSVHTSPLDRPGIGDAGGMNVYIAETAKQLARRNIAVDVFTRATSPDQPAFVEAFPGVTVHHVAAGPFGGLLKEDLPGQLCAVTAGVLRAEANRPEGWFDAIHSHYWLSGQVGWLASERWRVPLIHSMHTMAKVKNLALADGDVPEPTIRVIGEEQVVQAASRLVANTHREAAELIEHYDAQPQHVSVVHPGVDLDVFTVSDGQAAARLRLGFASDDIILLFVGRIQPLKAPDVLIAAAREVLRFRPELANKLKIIVCGGPSGTGLERPDALIRLSEELGLSQQVRFEQPKPATELADWYRAANVVCVPSYSESFGLVAVEAQACGTPVIAAAVGGLVTAVKDGFSGLLVPGHDPTVWAAQILRIVESQDFAHTLHRGALQHSMKFSWSATADLLVDVYQNSLKVADVHELRRA